MMFKRERLSIHSPGSVGARDMSGNGRSGAPGVDIQRKPQPGSGDPQGRAAKCYCDEGEIEGGELECGFSLW